MKKNKYIWMAVLPMFLSACQDEMIENSFLQNESVYTLSGKMTGGNALSRAQIQLGNTDASAGEVFLWNSGDSFKLYQSFDGQLKSSEFSISNDYSESGEGGNTTAVFTFVSNTLERIIVFWCKNLQNKHSYTGFSLF